VTVDFDVVGWTGDGAVRLLDQTRLPGEEKYLEIGTIDEMAEAIGTLRVRGAPLIGIAAAMGLAAAARTEAGQGALTGAWVEEAADRLESVRPTAVNLAWALGRMRRAAVGAGEDPAEIAGALAVEAQRIWDEDRAMCRAIGEAGAELIQPGSSIMTHCNAGALATGGIGTALATIYVAHQRGVPLSVIVTETRPLRQGARLTAWELSRSGVPARVIVDGAAGSVMARGGVDLIITGADRIAANGDVANKIGTYGLAVLARAHSIPFYVAAPLSTFDPDLPTGDDIPIEQRSAHEVEVAPGVDVLNPAFDVTPAELITALVTDRGVLRPPYEEAIRKVLR
jgi:methylthioribose-1-phosphate isomerase